MSSSIFFYNITRYESDDKIVKTADLDYNQRFEELSEDNDIPDWVKNNSYIFKIEDETLDIFAVGEKLFGKKPSSVRYNCYRELEHTFVFENGETHEVKDSDLDEFYETRQFDGYIYNREVDGEIEDSYLIEDIDNFNSKQLSVNDVENILTKYMKDYKSELDSSDYYGHYLYPVYALVKVMFEVKQGKVIVCEKC